MYNSILAKLYVNPFNALDTSIKPNRFLKKLQNHFKESIQIIFMRNKEIIAPRDKGVISEGTFERLKESEYIYNALLLYQEKKNATDS